MKEETQESIATHKLYDDREVTKNFDGTITPNNPTAILPSQNRHGIDNADAKTLQAFLANASQLENTEYHTRWDTAVDQYKSTYNIKTKITNPLSNERKL
jgi:hypothetical protein